MDAHHYNTRSNGHRTYGAREQGPSPFHALWITWAQCGAFSTYYVLPSGHARAGSGPSVRGTLWIATTPWRTHPHYPQSSSHLWITLQPRARRTVGALTFGRNVRSNHRNMGHSQLVLSTIVVTCCPSKNSREISPCRQRRVGDDGAADNMHAHGVVGEAAALCWRTVQQVDV